MEVGVIAAFVGLVAIPILLRREKDPRTAHRQPENVIRDPLFSDIAGDWVFDVDGTGPLVRLRRITGTLL